MTTCIPISHSMPVASFELRIFPRTSHECRQVSPSKAPSANRMTQMSAPHLQENDRDIHSHYKQHQRIRKKNEPQMQAYVISSSGPTLSVAPRSFAIRILSSILSRFPWSMTQYHIFEPRSKIHNLPQNPMPIGSRSWKDLVRRSTLNFTRENAPSIGKS